MKPIKEGIRWFGKDDTTTLTNIIQTGATHVVSSLHHIPYGEAWPRTEIRDYKAIIEDANLEWETVESVPVHEDIKTRSGNFEQYIENYKTSLKNLAAEGLKTVIYNFMPVLDWVRTDMGRKLDIGTECLYYNPIEFAAFDIFMLKRKDAEKDHTPQEVIEAKKFHDSLSPKQRADFTKSIIDIFPGCKLDLTVADIRDMIDAYHGITHDQLQENLKLFLNEVVPVAESAGIRMAIHPDDPPYSILGLPRIVCCEQDLQDILAMYDSPSNGICFCAGSLSPRAANDLPGMIKRLGHRINFAHLRNTQREDNGIFFEANHLSGSVDMFAVVKALLLEQQKREQANREDWQLILRPDHGHTILDDLQKPPPANPGYTCIGRMKALAELRGLQLGIIRSHQ